MVDYVIESWHIFTTNLAELTGYKGILALVFLLAVFLVFWKASRGFGSWKDD